jgi:hypothetical protein
MGRPPRRDQRKGQIHAGRESSNLRRACPIKENWKVRARRDATAQPYSARNIEAGSIPSACITGRSDASNAPAKIARDGSASICKSVAFT